MTEENLLEFSNLDANEEFPDSVSQEELLDQKKRQRDKLGSVNLRADEEQTKYENEIKKIVESIAQVKKEWEADWAPLLNSNDVPINPYRLITEINNAVDHENTIMTHDAGHPRDQIMPFYPATVPNSYIGWGKSTHLGYGLPLVIGAKIAHPEKFCVNFMGDTAFGLSGL